MQNIPKVKTGARFTIGFCILLSGIVITCAWRANAFALLGPFESWMQQTNDLRQPGDIGGPMCIGNEYRWDVPVVTYGFDPSFCNFFGTNGEAAVESAIQIINALPPASDIALTNYPFDSTMAFDANALYLFDLKSWTLSMLLEQLGLAQPTRYIFVLRQWNPLFSAGPLYENSWPDWVIPDYISERNFDPQTFESAQSVNGTLYSGEIYTEGDENFLVPFPVDATARSYTAVADQALSGGEYYAGLTYDDVGGLRYLYSTNNTNYETLLPDVSAANHRAFVNGAWRPGLNKITFVPQMAGPDPGTFRPTTILFTDTYITNGVRVHQQLKRVVVKPDFLFCAGDVNSDGPGITYFATTGTTNWLNNAAANGNTNGAGPGVIRPPIQIVFDKLGPLYFNSGYGEDPLQVPSYIWGSYGDSTNAPVTYPVPQTGTNQIAVYMWLYGSTEFQQDFVWRPVSAIGAQFALQSSTNLANWTTLFTVTNTGCICTYLNASPLSGSQFYRLVPQ
jgi:hypothetical protein